MLKNVKKSKKDNIESIIIIYTISKKVLAMGGGYYIERENKANILSVIMFAYPLVFVLMRTLGEKLSWSLEVEVIITLLILIPILIFVDRQFKKIKEELNQK